MIVYERAYSSELKVMVLATHEQRHWRVIAEIKTKHFPVKIYVEALWVEGDFPQTDTIASELVDDLEPLSRNKFHLPDREFLFFLVATRT